MKQISLGLNLSTKKTRKREFLEEMDKVVPWDVPVQIVAPHCSKAKTGRPAFSVETMLRIHYLQQWSGLSDPAMEESLHDVPVYREFAKLDGVLERLPDESTINAPSSTKNARGERDPEMHQTKKGNQWYFGMKAHIGVDADPGWVHSVITTAANVNDVTQANALLHGEEVEAYGDSGY